MAQYYASIQGSRGLATRMGDKGSGMEAHVRGWNVGVRVYCFYDDETGLDVCEIYETGGSNNPSAKRMIGKVKDRTANPIRSIKGKEVRIS